MKRIMLTALIALHPVAAVAQDWQKAKAAYQVGDYATALEEFRLLAEEGDAAAQNNLGAMYYYGLGLPLDLDAAVRWFRHAAEQGNADGQNNLGAMYDTGLGVPKDHAEAVRLYRLAAVQGHAGGQFNLGLMYSRGEGVLQDYVAAHMWFNIASANGMELGHFMSTNLAKLLTPEQLLEARHRAEVCKESQYEDCA